jgi:hypothetical protein
MDTDIEPFCIYHNVNKLSGYIGPPTKYRENGVTKFKCAGKSGVQLVGKFWAIRPTFRPIPPGASLLCAKASRETGHETLSIKTVYDPFHLDSSCVMFIAWVEPVPYTTPLYIYKHGETIFPSFSSKPPSEFHKEILISPIYVLTEPGQNITYVPGLTDTPKEFGYQNEQPQFLFSGYQGRCLPDPDGMPLGECAVLYIENILDPELSDSGKQPTLLNQLQLIADYNKEKENVFKKIGTVPIVISLFVLLLSIVIVILLLCGKK